MRACCDWSCALKFCSDSAPGPVRSCSAWPAIRRAPRLLEREIRDETVLGEALVDFLVQLGGFVVGTHGGGDGALRQPLGVETRLQAGEVGFGGATAGSPRRSTAAATAESVNSRITVSGVTMAPGRSTIRSTRPCVAAGTQRRASSTGTSVPRPRTWRSIDPRLTVSTQTVARSTVGAAGLRRASTTDTKATTRMPAMADGDPAQLLLPRHGCGSLNVHSDFPFLDVDSGSKGCFRLKWLTPKPVPGRGYRPTP